MAKKVAVLDTMLFLHYRQVEQINWLQMLEAEEVELVLAPAVVRELNKHKDQGKARARTAARRIDEWFSEGSTAAIRNGVSIRLEPVEPRITHADLDESINDDRLIATCLNLASDSAAVTLVTADALMKAKARAHGISVVTPADSDKLPEDLDPQEKELRKLRDENQRLKARQPRLLLRDKQAKDGRHSVVLTLAPGWTDEYKQDLLARVMKKHPMQDVPEGSGGGLDRLMAQIGGSTNKSVEAYYRAFMVYLHKLEIYEVRRSRAIHVELELANEGAAPAGDIDVSLECDLALRPFREEDLVEPLEPEPPARDVGFAIPNFGVSAINSSAMDRIHADMLLGMEGHWDMDTSVPGVRMKTNVPKLKHGNSWTLDAFYVAFNQRSKPESFALNYRINCDELDDIEGQLHFEVQWRG